MTTSLNLYQYSNIVIDYSVMFAELDDWLVEQLMNNDRVWVSPTFVCDCHHFSKNVSAKIKNTYQTNANLFEYASSRVCNMWGVVDTFNLARWFSTNHGSTIVIAANFSLEDRIIFSGLNVDIYCWYQNRIIKHQSFANEQSERQIDKNKDPLPFYEMKAGNYVYSNMGAYILDGDPNDIGRGAEASIYEVRNNPNLLAKIYGLDNDDRNTLTKQKYRNIEKLIDLNLNTSWLALPQTILFADVELTKPVGYLMQRINKTFMSDIPLFASGDIRNKLSQNKSVTVRHVLRTCIQFVSQFMFLSVHGINLADYNDRNFALTKVGYQGRFYMVDTDSYCYEEYVCDYSTYANSLSRSYQLGNKLDLIRICDESLFVYIFTLLTLAPDCKPVKNNEFRFSKAKLDDYSHKGQYINLARWCSIPKNLQTLYINVFEKKQDASVSVLLYELERAIESSLANSKYSELYKMVDSRPADEKASQPHTKPNEITKPKPIEITKPKPNEITQSKPENKTTSTSSSYNNQEPGVNIARFIIGIILFVLMFAGLMALIRGCSEIMNGAQLSNAQTVMVHLCNSLVT